MNLGNDSFQIQTLGIGDAMVDLYTRASQLPSKGGNIWSTAVEMSPGGTTANVSANIARLGISSAFIGRVGSDPYGQYIIDEFKKVGVETGDIFIKKGAFTGIVLGIIDDQGERTFIACAKGASHTLLTKSDVHQINFEKYQNIHTSGVCLVEQPSRESLLVAMEIAHTLNKKIYFDPNLRLEGNVFPEELREAQYKAISLSDVVLIGEEELFQLCGCASIEEGSERLLEKGAELIVVKQGGKGVVAITSKENIIVPSFNVKVCNTAGAGDAFDAAFIAAQLRNANLLDALIYANAVAAIKVTRKDARSAPTHTETIEFLNKRNIQIGTNIESN